MVKPMPGTPLAPSLAESWSISATPGIELAGYASSAPYEDLKLKAK